MKKYICILLILLCLGLAVANLLALLGAVPNRSGNPLLVVSGVLLCWYPLTQLKRLHK